MRPEFHFKTDTTSSSGSRTPKETSFDADRRSSISTDQRSSISTDQHPSIPKKHVLPDATNEPDLITGFVRSGIQTTENASDTIYPERTRSDLDRELKFDNPAKGIPLTEHPRSQYIVNLDIDYNYAKLTEEDIRQLRHSIDLINTQITYLEQEKGSFIKYRNKIAATLKTIRSITEKQSDIRTIDLKLARINKNLEETVERHVERILKERMPQISQKQKEQAAQTRDKAVMHGRILIDRNPDGTFPSGTLDISNDTIDAG